MVILKKIKGSTLMETLVASVLVVIIFMVASMILNNLFSNTIRKDPRAVNVHLNELRYLYLNGKQDVPFQDDFIGWRISINRIKDDGQTFVIFKAQNSSINKEITKTLHEKD